MPGASERKLEIIQLLRAVAVLCVVASHIAHELSGMLAGRISNFNDKLFPGDFGVDLFFVISGFIMVHTCWNVFGTQGASTDFLKRRIIRIVPLYWVATTLMIAVVILYPGKVNTATSDWQQWLASYLFFPYAREGDGMVRPVLGLGWSLQYEMFFYALFALVLVLPRRIAIETLIILLVAFSALTPVLTPEAWRGAGLVRFLGHPIMLEFAAGALLGYVYQSGLRLPGWAGWSLAALGVVLLVIVPPFNDAIDQWRFIHYGIPASLMVGAAILTCGLDEVRIFKPGREIGEVSYSIYLTHPFVIGAMSVLFSKAGLVTSMAPLNLLFTFSVSIVVISLVAGYLVHYWFDLPLTNRLRRAWRPNPAHAGPAQSGLAAVGNAESAMEKGPLVPAKTDS